MILLLPGQTKHVYLKCGCRKTEVDADDFGTWARKCRVCKRWTRYTVQASPSGRRVEVKVEFAPMESPTVAALGDEAGEGDGGLSLSSLATKARPNTRTGAPS